MLLIKGLIIFWILFVLHLLHAHPVSHKSKSGIAIWALKADSNKTLRESKENFSSSKYSRQLQLKETLMFNAHRLKYSHGWSSTGKLYGMNLCKLGKYDTNLRIQNCYKQPWPWRGVLPQLWHQHHNPRQPRRALLCFALGCWSSAAAPWVHSWPRGSERLGVRVPAWPCLSALQQH